MSGASSPRRQNGPFSAMRHLMLAPICGASVGGSGGSIAILFHAGGGAVSTRARPRAPCRCRASRARRVRHRDVRTGVRVSTRAAPIAAASLVGELLVAALAAIDLAIGPELLDPAALHHREVAQVALPLGDRRRCRPSASSCMPSLQSGDAVCASIQDASVRRSSARRPAAVHGSYASTFAASAFMSVSALSSSSQSFSASSARQALAVQHDRRLEILLD